MAHVRYTNLRFCLGKIVNHRILIKGLCQQLGFLSLFVHSVQSERKLPGTRNSRKSIYFVDYGNLLETATPFDAPFQILRAHKNEDYCYCRQSIVSMLSVGEISGAELNGILANPESSQKWRLLLLQHVSVSKFFGAKKLGRMETTVTVGHPC